MMGSPPLAAGKDGLGRRVIMLVSVMVFVQATAGAANDLLNCLPEIQRVCAGLEDKLESCVDARGAQLSATCREQLKGAIALAQDPSGPAACVPDIKRLCPDVSADSLARCITEQQSRFSDTCRKYLNQGGNP